MRGACNCGSSGGCASCAQRSATPSSGTTRCGTGATSGTRRGAGTDLHPRRTLAPAGRAPDRSLLTAIGAIGRDSDPCDDALAYRASVQAGRLAGRLEQLRPGPDAFSAATQGIPQGHARGDDGRPLGGTRGDITWLTKEIQYRAVAFEVPLPWFSQWTQDWESLDGSNGGAGLVSSVDDCLDAIWPTYRSATSTVTDMADADIDGLLGCYSLGSVAGDSLFWREGAGSHREVFRHLCRLLAIYSDHIRDDFLGPSPADPDLVSTPIVPFSFDFCEGLGDFCRRLLQGRTASDRYGDSRCRLTLQFDSYSPGLARQTVDESDCYGSARVCGEWYRAFEDGVEEGVEVASEWERWQVEGAAWSSGQRAYVVPGTTSFIIPSSATTSDAFASADHWVLTFHPVHLAWLGFVSDRILHRARIAYDYHRATGRLDHLTDARRLGAYAIQPWLWLGALLVHELGHIYYRSTAIDSVFSGAQWHHCVTHGCADGAGYSWACAMHGILGLPPPPADITALDAKRLMFAVSGDVSTEDARAAALARDFGGGTCIFGSSESAGIDTAGRLDPCEVTYDWSCQVTGAGEAGDAALYCVSRAAMTTSVSSTIALPDSWCTPPSLALTEDPLVDDFDPDLRGTRRDSTPLEHGPAGGRWGA